jgi:CubicO group peptidase (beta-lactamase class C family)
MLAGLGSRPTPAGLSVIDGTEVVHQNLRGGLAVDAPMPIASASKWLAVATILSVVDEGLLELDAPVAEYVVELDRPDKRTMTLRQCMSCTAGWSGFLLGEQPGWGSDEFAVAARRRVPLRRRHVPDCGHRRRARHGQGLAHAVRRAHRESARHDRDEVCGDAALRRRSGHDQAACRRRRRDLDAR